MAVGKKYPKARILVLEKGAGCCATPATFAREGNRSMVEFCRGHGLKHEVCGKVMVATKRADLTLLDRLYRRGLDTARCYAARARTSAGD